MNKISCISQFINITISAVYLEDAAKTYIMARVLGTPTILTEEQVEEAVRKFKPGAYGQH